MLFHLFKPCLSGACTSKRYTWVQWDTVIEYHIVPVHHTMCNYNIIESFIVHRVPLNPRIPLPVHHTMCKYTIMPSSPCPTEHRVPTEPTYTTAPYNPEEHYAALERLCGDDSTHDKDASPGSPAGRAVVVAHPLDLAVRCFEETRRGAVPCISVVLSPALLRCDDVTRPPFGGGIAAPAW